MNKTFEYDRNSCMLFSLGNRPVCSCKSSTVVVLQMKTATCRWQRKRRWSQYINSSSCNDLQKNTIDALQKSKKTGNQEPFIHSKAAPLYGATYSETVANSTETLLNSL